MRSRKGGNEQKIPLRLFSIREYKLPAAKIICASHVETALKLAGDLSDLAWNKAEELEDFVDYRAQDQAAKVRTRIRTSLRHAQSLHRRCLR